MNRTRRFLSAVWLSYGNQILVMLVGLWLTPFLLHRLGQHDYGVWLVGLQSLTYLSLLDVGIIGLLPREVAFASGNYQKSGDPAPLRSLLEETFVIILWQLPILLCAMGVAEYVIAVHYPELSSAFLIVLLSFCVQFPLRLFLAALEGLQDFTFLGYLQIAGWILGVSLNVLLIVMGYGLLGLAFGWSLQQLTVMSGALVRMYWRYPELSPRRVRRLATGDLFRCLRSSFWVSLSQVTQLMIRGTDIVLLGALRGPAAVVPYSCTTKLQFILANQPQVILQSAQSGLTQLRATADREHLGRVIGALAQAMLMLSGGAACIILGLNRGFVYRWVGPSQYIGVAFTILITVGMVLRHLNTTNVYTLFCFGKERYIALIGLADGVLAIIGSIILVRQFGAIGIPIAYLLSLVVTSLPWNYLVLKRVTGLSVREQLIPIGQWLLPFLLVAIPIAVLGAFLPASSYLRCALIGGVLGLVYIGAESFVIRRSRWSGHIWDLITRTKERIWGLWKLPAAAALGK